MTTPDQPGAGGIDAYTPAEVARRVELSGVQKANLPALQTLTLGGLAGAFIAFGAAFYTVVVSDPGLGFGPARLLGGLAFSLGLILVVVAGAELFTGNNLIVIAWVDRRISTALLLRNWSYVYIANFAGAGAIAVLVHLSGVLHLGGGVVQETAISIGLAKLDLGADEAFLRGLLCNVLVCLAIWLCMAAHGVSGRILAILFPISGFVALGFEHSVANMYFLPLAMLQGAGSVPALLANLAAVTAGNVVGGSVFVALTYWAIYLKDG